MLANVNVLLRKYKTLDKRVLMLYLCSIKIKEILTIKALKSREVKTAKDMKNFRNFTPHKITLNNGTSFDSEGVARVSASFTDFDSNGVCRQVFGEVQGLPEPQDGVFLIVSAIVLSASDRTDLIAPATGHPECVRNENGFIVSVPGFVSK